MSLVDKKKNIRKQLSELKNRISFDEKIRRSESILENLEANRQFKSAKIVMMYWSMKDEVYTHEFIKKWAGKKKILLPSVNGDHLKIKEYTDGENMIKGEQFAIQEPEGEEFSALEKIDLIVVPGVAFDKNNNRLGRGKAYYDKLLKTFSVRKIGICFNFQLLEYIPTDENDVKMDHVISE